METKKNICCYMAAQNTITKIQFFFFTISNINFHRPTPTPAAPKKANSWLSLSVAFMFVCIYKEDDYLFKKKYIYFERGKQIKILL